MSKHLKYRVEYLLLTCIRAILYIMPLWCVYRMVDILAWLAFHVIGIRRDVTLENLRTAFGDQYSESELVRIGSQSYRHIGATFVEMAISGRFSDKAKYIMLQEDADKLVSILSHGKGLILVSAHFGSWEMNGASIASYGFPIYAVAKPQKNPYVDAFINHGREAFGLNVISTGAAIKNIVRALREGAAVGLISDQDAGRKGTFVDFFGRPASTRIGAAQLALKYGAPVVVVMTLRTSFGSYRTILEEIPVLDNDSIVTLTQRYTTAMEKIIRRYPEQYFWMHRRWKTPPPEITAVEDNAQTGKLHGANL